MKDKLIKLLSTKIAQNGEIKKKILLGELLKITGIGHRKAADLINKGLTTIAQLHQARWWEQLNSDTKTVLSMQPPQKIPHSEIHKIEHTLTSYPNAKITLVGSYRRKKATSKDIDVMLVSSKISAISEYIEWLSGRIKKLYVYSRGGDKASLILDMGKGKKYKADIFRAHPDYYWSHLLYATGSKSNNIRMRAKARRLGYILNQKGLWEGKERVLGPSSDERAYYKKLDMPYLTPENR